MTPRSRKRILENLESIYRDAYQKAGESQDGDRMAQLDWSYQREQLVLEVLMDIRDALGALAEAPDSKSALEKLETLRKLTKLK
jgi:hypothetical protein